MENPDTSKDKVQWRILITTRKNTDYLDGNKPLKQLIGGLKNNTDNQNIIYQVFFIYFPIVFSEIFRDMKGNTKFETY